MKLFGRFHGLQAVGGASLMVALLVMSAQAQTREGTATVLSVKGSADYSEGGGTWSALRTGKVLGAGAVIRTADGSEVDLDLKRNGPVVRLMPSTTLGLTALYYEDTGVEVVIDTQLDLKAGRILGVVNKMAVQSKYEVKTPTSVVGIRGTKYDITADGKVVVLEGWVMVVYADATGRTMSYRVEAGQTFDPTTQTVRPSTPDEIREATDNMPTPPPPPEMKVYVPVELPVSAISPATGGGNP